MSCTETERQLINRPGGLREPFAIKKLNVFDVFENCKNIRNDLFHFYYESGDL